MRYSLNTWSFEQLLRLVIRQLRADVGVAANPQKGAPGKQASSIDIDERGSAGVQPIW